MNISILGAGAWGSTIADLLANKGYNVKLWVREHKLLQDLKTKRENTMFLPGIKLAKNLLFTQSFDELLDNCNILVIAIPARFLRATLEQIKDRINKDLYIVNLAKGLESVGGLQTASGIIDDVLGNGYRVSTLSGPNIAQEVAQRKLSQAVIASLSQDVLEFLEPIFETEYFQIHTSTDLVGVEISGSLKSIIVCAACMAEELEDAHNTKAAILSQGLSEMIEVGEYFNAHPETFFSLCGIGDLIVSAYSQYGRNCMAGALFAQTKSFEEIKQKLKGKTLEGAYTVQAVFDFNEKEMHLSLPIITEMYRVIYEGKDPKQALNDIWHSKK